MDQVLYFLVFYSEVNKVWGFIPSWRDTNDLTKLYPAANVFAQQSFYISASALGHGYV